ncbi:hypothetical protein [Streptomyces roseoverticillatus]|uniref:hypothetical protein n=1 Tax=Streptomyces roseoverticillatus TaxID=66429 RepID=UPI000A65D852|nr:hypothetical protein [Streptomyces roseoverticillatus]
MPAPAVVPGVPVTAEFGVSLPRSALTSQDCRLHRFTTRSWTRPPGPGETYVVVRWE